MAKKKASKFKGNTDMQKTKAAIVKIVRSGRRDYQAARQVGITQECFRKWKERDVTFVTELVVAREEFLEELTKLAMKGAKSNPSMALKMLERQDRENWGEVQKIETKQEVSVTGEVKIDKHTQGQLDEIVRKLAAPE